MPGILEIAYIDSYDETHGHYFVRMPGLGIYSPPVDAYMVSSTPGGGMKGAPKIPKDTEVLLTHIGDAHFIVGFPQGRGPVCNNSFFPVVPTGLGDTIIADPFGRTFGIKDKGTFFVNMGEYANMAIDRILKALTVSVRNLRINFFTGSAEYEYDEEKKTAKAKFLVKKKLSSALPGVPQPDRIVVEAGKLESDSHLVETQLWQEMTPTQLPAFKSVLKWGKQTSGKWFDWFTGIGAIAAAAIGYSIVMNADGLAEFTINKGATPDSQVDVKLDMAGKAAVKVAKGTDKEILLEMDASTGVTLTVNKDKAVITIDGATGDITIKQTDAAKLYLGGKDKAQQLVTKSWIDMIFKNHVHPTAATGPPSMPVPIPLPVVADAKTNPYTFTTYGE